MVLTMEFDYFEAQPHWQLVHSVPVFDNFVCVGSKRSYYDLFEGYPSNIEQETPSCLLQLHRVTMPLPDSSSELPTLVSAPNFDKALFEGPKRSCYNLFEVYPSIIEREQLSCSPVFLYHRKHTRWRCDNNLLPSFVVPLFGPVRTGLGQVGPK